MQSIVWSSSVRDRFVFLYCNFVLQCSESWTDKEEVLEMLEEHEVKMSDAIENKDIAKRSDKKRLSVDEQMKVVAEKRAKLNEEYEELQNRKKKEAIREIVSDLRKAANAINVVCILCWFFMMFFFIYE